MKKDKINNLFKILFVVFLIIQPLLDTYYLYTEDVISIFKFSPSTLIRFIFIGIVFVYMLFKYKRDKKIIPLILYGILSVIYAIIHHLTVRNFNSLSPDGFGYSKFKEFFYIARLVIPVLIIFITIDFEFKFEDLIKIFGIVTCIVGTTIVVSNLFKIGLGSYTNEVIQDNIIGWFTGAYSKYSFYELATKGWFNFANQISGLLVMLSIPTIYSLLKKTNVYHVYNFIVLLLSMMMIGTKVALYMILPVMIGIIGIYVIAKFISKSDIYINKASVIIIALSMICYCGMIKYSPAINRATINNDILANRENKDEDDDDDSENKMEEINRQLLEVKKQGYEEKIAFIEENYGVYSINDEFILNAYSYKVDPDFWLEEFQKPLAERLNYRKLEEEMIKRVKNIDGKATNNWFGISYIRVQNIFNIERDFVLQYYTIGIVGVILFIVIPFIILTAIAGIYMLKKYKSFLTVENMLMVLVIASIIGIAYFSGNVIDSLIITIYLSFIIGVLLKQTVFENEMKLIEQENIKE